MQGFIAVFTSVRGYIQRFNERFNDVAEKSENRYTCPYETRDANAGAGRPKFFIPLEYGWRNGAKFNSTILIYIHE